jgi:hypothetical protein
MKIVAPTGRRPGRGTVRTWLRLVTLGGVVAWGGAALAQPTAPQAINLESISSLDEAQARFLVQGKRTLTLPSLRELSPQAAAILATNKGALVLDGINKLSPEVAQALAACQTSLDLNGVSTLDPAAANVLARSRAKLALEGLTVLDSVPLATKLATQGSPVELPRVKQVPKEVAVVLAKSRGDLHLEGLEVLDNPALVRRLATRSGDGLILSGVKTITPEAYKGFERTQCDISLPTIKKLDDESAKGFIGHQGSLDFDNLEEVSPQALAILLANRGPVDLASLKSLGDPPPPEVLRAIEKGDWPLSLSSLTTIHPDLAAAFRKRTGMVELFGIQSLTPELAGSLVNCKSYIWLTEVGEIDAKTAEVLLTHRGSTSGFVFPADLISRLPGESAQKIERHKGIHFGTIIGK